VSDLLGFAFPFRIVAGAAPGSARLAGVARSSGADKVRDDVRHLLSTGVGERPMLRDYGGGVELSRQEPNTATLGALVRHEIEQALRVFLPEARRTTPIELQFDESDLTLSFEYAADQRDIVQRIELTL
jgi:phage baseplate assembly protein W